MEQGTCTGNGARREADETKTLRAMLDIYCRGNHNHDCPGELCVECRSLFDYAQNRVALCPQRDDKPTCQDCKVHCFAPEYREKITQVMRYSGPRMLTRHPVLALRHLIRGTRQPKKR